MLQIHLLPIVTAKRLGCAGDEKISSKTAEKLFLMGIISQVLKSISDGEKPFYMFEQDICEGISNFSSQIVNQCFSFALVEDDMVSILGEFKDALNQQIENEL